ncbi:PREDICTED: uncharacterized protein LOC101314385 isoform X1 [Fragaria vesca subsp. vesca]|uniref:uncharacterized protein LOC101314385 isoform X1 n=1 Tax=Fragaria vesca subsp. vesca TaxID=101020 RepID=UPI0002C34E1A|nr:PREDICTED: uncharacterized protein LOC101314385 isoform X1 [Fragaria vesca subsp. vesca]
MGSSGSKAATPSSSGDGGQRRRSKSFGGRVFRSSCLRIKSRSHRSDDDEQVCEHQNKGSRIIAPCTNQTVTDQDRAKEYFRKVNVQQSDEMPCISSNVELNEWGDASINDTVSRTDPSSAQDSATPSLNPSGRFLSRFSFVPGNVSFRLSRATSLGSSRSYPLSSTSVTVLNNDDDLHLQTGPSTSLVGRDESQEGCEFLPESLVNRAPTQFFEDTSGSLGLNTVESGFSGNLQDNQTNSSIQVGRNANGRIIGVHNRYSGSQEPVERNVRFSRTLSVGRLRDRVLRRSSLSDLTFSSMQQEGEVRDTNQGDDTRTLAPESSVVNLQNGSGDPPSNMLNSLFSNQDFEVETIRPREARYHDLLEHRSNFLERRRRIRSQVRALQRLGSRFENVSGHERSCILSGHQRTGRCTCRSSNRDALPNDNSSARASISRIVMLAEALFEVLDEIHQQSVVLSSRPSVSSIGSVPAPNEVVESLPVKLFSKVQKHQNEEAAQCYICLVEYEEGDEMRILPCNHEFHKTCIDKWLKEIHRVCPLCRRDVCRSDQPIEN